MDATEVVVEDKFAGMTFGSACLMLFEETKSNAPFSEGFQNMIDHVRKVHESVGMEFNVEDYWNPEVFQGTHEVFPAELGQHLNNVPADITREHLREMIVAAQGLVQSNDQYRRVHERVANRARGSSPSGQGTIDRRILDRSVNSTPVFMAVSADSEEDDFI